MMQGSVLKPAVLAVAAALALTLAMPPAASASLRHRIRRPHAAMRAPSATIQRVARLTRLALLVRREAMLRDFLLTARTETPVLRDDRVVRLDDIEISETTVGRDFLGAAILRARVRNLRSAPQALELIADVASRGTHSTASTILTLHPGEARMVELLAPRTVTAPGSIRWSSVSF